MALGVDVLNPTSSDTPYRRNSTSDDANIGSI